MNTRVWVLLIPLILLAGCYGADAVRTATGIVGEPAAPMISDTVSPVAVHRTTPTLAGAAATAVPRSPTREASATPQPAKTHIPVFNQACLQNAGPDNPGLKEYGGRIVYFDRVSEKAVIEELVSGKTTEFAVMSEYFIKGSPDKSKLAYVNRDSQILQVSSGSHAETFIGSAVWEKGYGALSG